MNWEFGANEMLYKAEKYIHEAIKDGNSVWIELSDGRKIVLDEKCKINFLKYYGCISILED